MTRNDWLISLRNSRTKPRASQNKMDNYKHLKTTKISPTTSEKYAISHRHTKTGNAHAIRHAAVAGNRIAEILDLGGRPCMCSKRLWFNRKSPLSKHHVPNFLRSNIAEQISAICMFSIKHKHDFVLTGTARLRGTLNARLKPDAKNPPNGAKIDANIAKTTP
jgi:hypothetical protein